MSEKKISKYTSAGKLYMMDQVHLEKKVKNFKNLDPKFKDNSAALRHYVHLGIKAEANNLRREMENEQEQSLIPANQKNYGYNDSLLPLKNSIDGLINAVENLGKNQDNYFIGQSRSFDELRSEILTGIENIQTELKSVTEQSQSNAKNQNLINEILRNIVVLRCIHYVFLLGIKPGKPELDFSQISWQKVITITHQKAKQIADAELQSIETGELNNDTLKALSQEMFALIQQDARIK